MYIFAFASSETLAQFIFLCFSAAIDVMNDYFIIQYSGYNLLNLQMEIRIETNLILFHNVFKKNHVFRIGDRTEIYNALMTIFYIKILFQLRWHTNIIKNNTDCTMFYEFNRKVPHDD